MSGVEGRGAEDSTFRVELRVTRQSDFGVCPRSLAARLSEAI